MAISDRIKKISKESPIARDFGLAGDPIDHRSPFYFGFVATIGALTAFVLMRAHAKSMPCIREERVLHTRRASPACAKSESLHSKSDDERKGVERVLHTPGASPSYA